MRLFPLIALTVAAAAPAEAAQVDDVAALAMAIPQELIVASGMSPTTRDALLKPVDAFYGFWENGSPALLRRALSPRFVDHTLPPGRPQGPSGPVAASKAFLAAVPDLRMDVVQRLVVGDRVVSHLHFTGHFTGSLDGVQGKGQAIDFIATDILRIQKGQITDNWHLEDNLTFLRQVGIVPAR
ncbi:ester cyclase [Novosphingobium sp. SG707]|uniref:ester cyclase n=1 Tax=Novosphingobium sp. SG707 TaxID=2586996 RepID=UPI001833176D|nr:ester cyclase [Novosphingobium sp. SG707]NKJ02055.1 putative ester cyclase [Novosphingobium sp. SG707]